MNRDIKVIESGFRAVAAGMGDWDKTSAGLEARIKSLNSQIDVQKTKVAAFAEMHRKVAAAQGEDSRAAEDLQIKLNQETEALNRMQGELNQSKTSLDGMKNASKSAGDETDRTKKSEDKATTSTKNWGTALQGLQGHLRAAASGAANFAANVARAVAKVAIGLATMATAAAVGIGALLVKTIGPASDLNETVSKVGVVFGDASAKVLAFGKSAATALGMSQNAALTAAGTYGNLFRAMGMTNSKSAEMSTELVKLAGDLASFNNMDTVDVLDKLRAGLTGETEPLKSLGVNISANAVKAKAMAMGLKEVNGELPAAAKAQATYALILEQTALAQGDFARTSSGLANQQRILAAYVENLRSTIGTGLLPLATLGATVLNNLFANPAVQAGVKTLTDAIGQFASAFQIGFGSGNLMGGITNALGALGKFSPIFYTLQSVVVKVSGYLRQFSSIISGLGSAQQKGAGIGGLIAQIIGDTASARAEMLQTGLGIVQGLMQGIVGALPALLEAGFGILQGLVTSILAAVPLLLPLALEMINRLVSFIMESLPGLLASGIQIILALVNGILTQLPMLVTTAIQLVVTLINGIAAALPQLMATIATIIPQVVIALIQNLPLLIQAALQLIVALVNGLALALPTLIAYIPQIMQAIFMALIQALPMIGEAAVELVLALITGIAGMLPQLGTSAVELIMTLADGMRALIMQIIIVGGEIVEGLWKGIVAKGDWLYKQFEGFIKNLIQAAINALSSHSPSKVFMKIGETIPQGLGVGIRRESQKVEQMIRGTIEGWANVNIRGGQSTGGDAGAGFGTNAEKALPPIQIYANVASDIDIYRLARLVAEEIARS